ncbi:type IX secretion system motor protein PorM/GldM [Dysgonomonas macrotermitis]|uniref:Gliding motility-associated protein GldM n=1 Tax=Dysgonomonas macrotermitis TaxID=1346286 RepID=A0A1M5CHE6_9BACT|nr:gliding motility protein GldM [Dysgonomonas macrotermitis]SHF54138.1 gliding motility-associated protein GldM [Dysgonomonas macrotermitis]
MASNNPRSPRQKMINLMYLVFIAMMALNVSSEVLDGFDLVEEGLIQTIKSTEEQNNIVIGRIENVNAQNPVKAGELYRQADSFVKESDRLVSYIQGLKLRIVQEADGKDGKLEQLDHKEDLDAASIVMLKSKETEGSKLRTAINNYRDDAMKLVANPSKKKIINDRLNTNVPKKGKLDNKNWEETLFEKMPAAAAVTLLTKIQSDIRSAQGEVLTDLYDNIGAKDFRVNLLEAQVVPNSEFVVAGGSYEGRVVISAMDTTKNFTYSIPSIDPETGYFKIAAGAVGVNKVFSGTVKLTSPDGTPIERSFESKYHVVPRTTTIQMDEANMLYAGEENKLTISVPGMSNDQLRSTISAGSITKSEGKWVATPPKGSTSVKISVYNGATFVSDQEFRVRELPDPAPYIEYKDAGGVTRRFKGGRIAKTVIVNADGIKASIDDGLLDRQFTVIRFSTVFLDAMNNAIREVSDGSRFTDRQKAQIRQLARGKSFFITDIKVSRGGSERDLNSIEVRIN